MKFQRTSLMVLTTAFVAYVSPILPHVPAPLRFDDDSPQFSAWVQVLPEAVRDYVGMSVASGDTASAPSSLINIFPVTYTVGQS